MSNIQNRMRQSNSLKLAQMSFIGALLIVAIHLNWPTADSGCLWILRLSVRDGIAGIALPYFFIVSGYFLAGHFDEPCFWRTEVAKRIRTLVVPYFLWLAVALAVVSPVSIYADYCAHRPFGTSVIACNEQWLRAWGLDLFSFPAGLGCLWYVRCLFLFVCTGSILRFLVRRLKYAWLLLSFVLVLIYSYFKQSGIGLAPMGFFTWGYNIPGLFYFSLGMTIGSHRLKFHSRGFAIACAAVGSVLLSLNVLAGVYHKVLVINLGVIYMPCLLYAAYELLPEMKLPTWLIACSFPIYLMHELVIWIVRFAISHAGFVRFPLGCLLLEYGTAVGLSVLVAVCIRKHAPRFASLCFGGR